MTQTLKERENKFRTIHELKRQIADLESDLKRNRIEAFELFTAQNELIKQLKMMEGEDVR